MVYLDAYFRTFFIKAVQYGTAFTINFEGNEYLITAKHLIDATASSFNIQVFHNNAWTELCVSVLGHGNGDADISVLSVPSQLTSTEFTLTPALGEFSLGQDVFFLGFPYKMWGNVGSFLDGRPCAFIKRGTLSFFDSTGNQELYVDAINNEGFSGGPILFYPPGRPRDLRVAGVVSKFRIEHETVLDGEGEVTEMKVPYNTGFLVTYGMKHVIEIIRRHRCV
jgi:hypothetical protein